MTYDYCTISAIPPCIYLNPSWQAPEHLIFDTWYICTSACCVAVRCCCCTAEPMANEWPKDNLAPNAAQSDFVFRLPMNTSRASTPRQSTWYWCMISYVYLLRTIIFVLLFLLSAISVAARQGRHCMAGIALYPRRGKRQIQRKHESSDRMRCRILVVSSKSRIVYFNT